MAHSVTHATTAVGTNNGNGEIGKNEWNANHTISLDASLIATSLSGTFLTVAGGDTVPDTWTIKITGDAAKSNPIPILEFADETTNISPQSGWLKIWAADNAADVGLRAMTTPGTNHSPITMFPKGTDGFRVKWDSASAATAYPTLELNNVASGGVSAGYAPYFNITHRPASPASDMFTGGLFSISTNSAVADIEYCGLEMYAGTVTAASETGYWKFSTYVSGTNAQRARIGNGLIVGTGTTFPGAGSISYSGNLYGSGSQGDIMYHDGTKFVSLSPGTSGHFLKTQGAGANPTWAAASGSAAGSDTEIQFNDGGTAFGGDSALTWNKTTNALTLAQGTITDPATPFTITSTWNDGADTFTGLLVNVTKTAANVASKFVDVQRGGTSIFNIKENSSGDVSLVWGRGTGNYVSSLDGGSNDFDMISGGSRLVYFRGTSGYGISVQSGMMIGFSSGTTPTTVEAGFLRVAAGIVGVRNGASTGGALSFIEQTAPSAPSANGCYIYAVDNGAGKTQLMAIFGSGAAQQIAIEP